MGMQEKDRPEFAFGQDGVVSVATYFDAEIVVTGIVGCAGTCLANTFCIYY